MATPDMPAMEDLTAWGWVPFFDEMESFVRELSRQAGVSNESYCEYAVERLETCIRSLSSLVNLFQSRPPLADDAIIVAQYSVQLVELLQCFRR